LEVSLGRRGEGRFEGKVWDEGEGERGNLREGKWGGGGREDLMVECREKGRGKEMI